MEEKNYWVLLYYCYTHIEDPAQFRDEHHQLCLDLGLLGRIIVAQEGLNGTVSGTPQACQQYMEIVSADPRFKDIDFKVDKTPAHTFQKINVRVKSEIVHSGLLHIHPKNGTGIHLAPEEFKKIKDDPDVVLLDMRSNYEHSVGKFKGALSFDIENFREFPEQLDQFEHLKDKKVITYCTGGVKCEKGSAYLLEKGFKNVYQLHGGIIKYGLEAGGEDFEGKCYVFDNRVAIDVNTVNPVVISKCFVCGTNSDRMVNCSNQICNNHVPICEPCGEKMQGACTQACFDDHQNRRPYDGTGYYAKTLNGYNPHLHSKQKQG